MSDLKYIGNNKVADKILPKMYPMANCKKNRLSPLYPMPGKLIKVKSDVSVATIENMDFFHDIVLSAKK